MTVRNGFYTLAASLLVAQNSFAAVDFGTDKAGTLKGGGESSGVEGIMSLVTRFLTFVTVIAVLYVIYAGFQVMTAGGDEEKLKKGKTIIIQVIIGIAIMWLAYSIVAWVMSAFGGSGA